MESEKGKEMKIIDYFTTENKPHWLAQIQKSDWSAGAFLHDLLKEGTLKALAGEQTKLFLLTEGDELISFCTLAERDDIQPTTLTPWIGFVYTYPEHRGHRHAQTLLQFAEQAAAHAGAKQVYISTNHQGLYEKYGYTYLSTMNDINGEPSRVYVKNVK